MKCSKCNKDIAHTSSFCGYCGEGVFVQKSTSERKIVKKNKIKFQVVLGLFVYLSLFLAFVFIISYNSCSRYCSGEEDAAWGWSIVFIISLVIYLIIRPYPRFVIFWPLNKIPKLLRNIFKRY